MRRRAMTAPLALAALTLAAPAAPVHTEDLAPGTVTDLGPAFEL